MKNSDYTYDYFLNVFEDAKDTASSLISGTDNNVLSRKPAEDKWSMLEILSHLVNAGNEYLSQLKKALDKPENNLPTGKQPFSPSLPFRWFIYIVSPENQWKVPTVPSFEPNENDKLQDEQVLDEFIKLQNEFLHIMKKAKLEGLDLSHIYARNPIIKIVPMSLTACFGVTDAHQRRHFGQMETLKSHFEKQA